MKIRSIALESFKSYSELQKIPMRDMTLFMGANSSGKTSAIQALLVLKQTMESSSQDIDLLLSGKYANIGDFHDAVNSDHDKIEIGLVAGDNVDETYLNSFSWLFVPVDERKTAALLEELKLSVPDGVIELRRISVNSEENRFQYYLNGEPTQYFSRIINLQIVDMDLGYNSDLNTMFCDYLSELSQIIFTGKDSRAPEISREEFAPLNALLAFEDAILSGLPVQRSKAENHNFLLSLTNSFCSKLSEDSYSDYWISASLRKYCWNSLMVMKDKLVHFREVYGLFCSVNGQRESQ